jgi:hypothetical protein
MWLPRVFWFHWVVQICGLFTIGKSQSSCIHVKDLEINFLFWKWFYHPSWFLFEYVIKEITFMQLSHLILFFWFFNIWVAGDFYFPPLCDIKNLLKISKLLVNLLWFTIDKKIKSLFLCGNSEKNYWEKKT